MAKDKFYQVRIEIARLELFLFGFKQTQDPKTLENMLKEIESMERLVALEFARATKRINPSLESDVLVGRWTPKTYSNGYKWIRGLAFDEAYKDDFPVMATLLSQVGENPVIVAVTRQNQGMLSAQKTTELRIKNHNGEYHYPIKIIRHGSSLCQK